LIHHRLKCGSILVSKRNAVKVAGFSPSPRSLEAALEGTARRLVGRALGTTHYESLEQGFKEELDERADIYSLGGVFYRALTGQLADQQTTEHAIGQRWRRLPWPGDIVSEIPRAIQRVVEKMMQDRREDRFQRMQEVVGAIDGALAAVEEDQRPIRVFISAKSADYEPARQVREFLASHGVRAFFSEWSLPELGTSGYHAAIESALEGALHIVIVASSRENMEGRWVRHEWETFLNERLAGRKSGNIVTVAVGGLGVGDMPLSLRRFETVPLSADGLDRLLQY
ncbi:unnamed protein product, partial [marine sediment metagenome]